MLTLLQTAPPTCPGPTIGVSSTDPDARSTEAIRPCTGSQCAVAATPTYRRPVAVENATDDSMSSACGAGFATGARQSVAPVPGSSAYTPPSGALTNTFPAETPSAPQIPGTSEPPQSL